jgi:AraC-like DNA-binding protein
MSHRSTAARRGRHSARGGLAPWQERRAKGLLDANLDGEIRLADVARACGLSFGYFAHAFKRSTGLAPHRWLLQRRVERAKDLLQRSDLPLAEIALTCGFADQSHLGRVFGRMVGTPPGAWRRRRRYSASSSAGVT